MADSCKAIEQDSDDSSKTVLAVESMTTAKVPYLADQSPFGDTSKTSSPQADPLSSGHSTKIPVPPISTPDHSQKQVVSPNGHFTSNAIPLQQQWRPSSNQQAIANIQKLKEGEQSWHTSFWDCFSPIDLFCTSLFCPCVQIGKTHARLKDPDLHDHTEFNSTCAGWFGLCLTSIAGIPLYWIIGMTSRRDIRAQYNLEGHGCLDCACAAFCCPCALAQEEKEVKYRNSQRASEFHSLQGYQQAPVRMMYGRTHGEM